MAVLTVTFAPCGHRGSEHRVCFISWPEVLKGVPNKAVVCSVMLTVGAFYLVLTASPMSTNLVL